MIWFFEQPLPILFLGVIGAVGSLVALVQTGRKVFLGAIILVVLLTGGLLIAERYVTTPREKVRQTLHAIAADLEKNDQQAFFAHLSATEERLRAEAERLLALTSIHEVKIKRNLEIEIDDGWEPTRAVARFNVMIIASDRAGVMSHQRIPRRLEVTFRQEEGNWRIRSYKSENPISRRK